MSIADFSRAAVHMVELSIPARQADKVSGVEPDDEVEWRGERYWVNGISEDQTGCQGDLILSLRGY